MKKENNCISRRNFLKTIGVGAAVLGAGACNVSKDEKPAENENSGEMTYRINSTTGDKVSILGYGCMRLPVIPVEGENNDPLIDQEEVNRQVDYAMAHGVNYYDTSPVYCRGRSEEAMGKALSRYPRDSYFLATKLSNFSPSLWPREKSIEMYEKSFEYLQTDYIDYLLLHSVGNGGMATFSQRYLDNGILDFMIEEQKKGKIRNLGFSYHGDIAVFDYLLKLQDEGKLRWNFAQIQLNYLDWGHAKDINDSNTDAEYLYSELEKRDIPVVIMEPLLGGRLSKLPNNIVGLMKQSRPDNSIASWAFRYAGTPEKVLTVLSGMTYMEHLEENVKTYSPLEPISEEENSFLERIATMILQFPTVPCNDCKYCMPCPHGVDIPAILLHYNKCVNEGAIVNDTRDPKYKEYRKRYLVGYDRSVPRLRQASHCIGCERCIIHCPQDINIPEELHKIDRYVESLKQNPA